MAPAATTPTSWCLSSHRIVHCGARIRARDGEALPKTRGYIAGTESDQFLVGIDLVTIGTRKALGRQHTTGEADQGNAGRIGKKLAECRWVDVNKMHRGQSGRNTPEYRDATLIQIEHRYRDDTGNHDDKGSRQFRCRAMKDDQGYEQDESKGQRRQMRMIDLVDKFSQSR